MSDVIERLNEITRKILGKREKPPRWLTEDQVRVLDRVLAPTPHAPGCPETGKPHRGTCCVSPWPEELDEQAQPEKPLHVQVAEALGWLDLRFRPPKNTMNLGDKGKWWGYLPPGPVTKRNVIPRYDLFWSAIGPWIFKLKIKLYPWQRGWAGRAAAGGSVPAGGEGLRTDPLDRGAPGAHAAAGRLRGDPERRADGEAGRAARGDQEGDVGWRL